MPSSLFAHARQWLSRPPLAWPRFFDRASEWWWAQPSRVRLMVPASAAALLLLGVSLSMTTEPTTAVIVAVRDIAPGTLIVPDDVRTEQRPRRYLPEALAVNANGVALSFIPKGSVLTHHHVGEGGVSVRVPDGQVAVAVPVGVLPPLALGDTLTFVAITYDGTADSFDHPATLVHAEEEVLWFAVLPVNAARIAAAAQAGQIGVIVHPRDQTP